MSRKITVIACAVLTAEIEKIISSADADINAVYLDAGLHEFPDRLRSSLQHEIDRVTAEDKPDLIVLGYGICGTGTSGLRSRGVPLAIAAVHDCISLFLGGAPEPGTFYLTGGWFEQKTLPWESGNCLPDFDLIGEFYGEENAESIRSFYDSWTGNYRKLVYIDTAGGSEAAESYSRELAARSGWSFDKTAGDTAVLEDLIVRTGGSSAVLRIEPGCASLFDSASRFTAVSDGGPEVWARALPSSDDSAVSGAVSGTVLGLAVDGESVRAAVVDAGTKRPVFEIEEPLDPNRAAESFTAVLDGIPPEYRRRTVWTAAFFSLEGWDCGSAGLLLMPLGRVPGALEPYQNRVIKGRMGMDGSASEDIVRSEILSAAAELTASGCDSFAVSGYASNANPEHELSVRDVLGSVYDCIICCGNEVSSSSSFLERTGRAASCAAVLPVFEDLRAGLFSSASSAGLAGGLTYVKSDGTLIMASLAGSLSAHELLVDTPADPLWALGRRIAVELSASVVSEGGMFRVVSGVDGVSGRLYGSYRQACDSLESELAASAVSKAAASGASGPIEWSAENIFGGIDGDELFIRRDYTARISSSPA